MVATRCLSGLVLFASGSVVTACGMNEHTVVAHRALSYYGQVSSSPNSSFYNDVLHAYPDSVLAGADFPDFLYACGNDHDAGEAAHWPPWQATAVNYTRTLPDFVDGNLTEPTKQFIAFILGVSVHYIADELWEGLNDQLKNGQGFVRVLSAANLNGTGTTDNNENPANMAGDFHLSYASDEQWLHPWQREYPLEKILTVYQLYGKPNVTLKSLQTCKLLFDLGLWAEQVFGRFLFIYQSSFDDFVPFVAEHDLELPVGGIDDMAVWGTWVWERVARWFDYGAPANPRPNANVNAANTRPGESYVYGRLRGQPLPVSRADAWVHAFTAELQPLREEAAKLMASGALQPHMFELVDPADRSAGVYYTGPEKYLGLAQSLLDVLVQSLIDTGMFPAEAADHLQLVYRPAQVGPEQEREREREREQEGKQEAEVDKEVSSLGKMTSVESLHGFGGNDSTPLGYQGKSLAVGDWNNDSIPDIAVSRYGWGTKGRAQVGQVVIQYGNSNGSSAHNGLTNVDTGNSANSTLTGSMSHARFGWDMASLDFNGDGIDDLCVSAPTAAWNNSLPVSDDTPQARFWGQVDCFFGTPIGFPTATTSRTANVSIRTQMDLTGLGLVMEALDANGDGLLDLFVGAPMNSNTTNATAGARADNIQRGLVLGFLSGPRRTTSSATSESASTSGSTLILAPARREADIAINGPTNFGWFGASIDLLDLPMPANTPAHPTLNNTKTQTRRFLLVGAPFYRTVNGSVGCLYAFDVSDTNTTRTSSDAHGNGNVKGTVSAAQAPLLAFKLVGVEHASEFAKSLAVVNGVTVGTATEQQVLVVGVPAAGNERSGVRLQAGKVHVLSATELVRQAMSRADATVTVDEMAAASVTILGGGDGTMLGRLGFSIAAGDVLAADGIPDIVISAPFASRNVQRLSGPEAGVVFALDASQLPAYGTVVSSIVNASAARVWGTDRHARWGATLQVLPQAQGVNVLESAVLVAAPMLSTTTTEMGGAVHVVTF